MEWLVSLILALDYFDALRVGAHIVRGWRGCARHLDSLVLGGLRAVSAHNHADARGGTLRRGMHPDEAGHGRPREGLVVNVNLLLLVDNPLGLGVLRHPLRHLEVERVGRREGGMIVLVLNHLEHEPAEVVETHPAQPLRLINADALRVCVLNVRVPDGRDPAQARNVRGKVVIADNLDLMSFAVDRPVLLINADYSAAEESHYVVLRL